MLSRMRLLRLLDVHVIISTRSDVLRQLAAHAANKSCDLPDLEIRDLPAERRHAIRPPFYDRVVYVLRCSAIDPVRVHQRRTNASTAMRMAADAVVRPVQALAFRYGVRVAFVGLLACRTHRLGHRAHAIRIRISRLQRTL